MRRTLYAEPADRETRRVATIAEYTAIDNVTKHLRRLHDQARITANVSLTAPMDVRRAAARERALYQQMIDQLEAKRRKVNPL